MPRSFCIFTLFGILDVLEGMTYLTTSAENQKLGNCNFEKTTSLTNTKRAYEQQPSLAYTVPTNSEKTTSLLSTKMAYGQQPPLALPDLPILRSFRQATGHENALCTGFSITVHGIHQPNAQLSIHLSPEFWEAVRFFGVKNVHFLPYLHNAKRQVATLQPVYCMHEEPYCSMSVSNKNNMLDKVDEIKVYLQCKVWPSFCDLCESAIKRKKMIKSTILSPTPGVPVQEPLPYTVIIVISVASVTIILVLITIVVIRKPRANTRSPGDETNEFHSLTSQGIENVIFVLCIGKVGREAEYSLHMYLNELNFTVIFIKEQLQEISKNINDWMANHAKHCRCILILHSKTRQGKDSIQDSMTEMILHRMSQITPKPKLAVISLNQPISTCYNLSEEYHPSMFTNDYNTSGELLDFIKDSVVP